MTTACLHLARNPVGRDLVVGDIHGMFSLLEAELQRIGFDPARDRVICVGDLVDRGPESHRVVELLRRPWFFSVLGNHDLLYLLWTEHFPLDDRYPWEWLIGENFRWYQALTPTQREELVAALGALPWLIEIDTEVGLVGVVHAEVPQTVATWAGLRERVTHCLQTQDFAPLWPLVWERQLFDLARTRGSSQLAAPYQVPDLAHAIHGHSIDENMRLRRLANRYYIDTGAYLSQPHYMATWRLKGQPRLTIVDARAPAVPL